MIVINIIMIIINTIMIIMNTIINTIMSINILLSRTLTATFIGISIPSAKESFTKWKIYFCQIVLFASNSHHILQNHRGHHQYHHHHHPHQHRCLREGRFIQSVAFICIVSHPLLCPHFSSRCQSYHHRCWCRSSHNHHHGLVPWPWQKPTMVRFS